MISDKLLITVVTSFIYKILLGKSKNNVSERLH